MSTIAGTCCQAKHPHFPRLRAFLTRTQAPQAWVYGSSCPSAGCTSGLEVYPPDPRLLRCPGCMTTVPNSAPPAPVKAAA
jgi:hypothetical protein